MLGNSPAAYFICGVWANMKRGREFHPSSNGITVTYSEPDAYGNQNIRYRNKDYEMTLIFEAVQENRPFIMNVYHSISKDKIESYLYKLTYQLIADVVGEKCAGMELAEEDKRFIAEFYKYGFVGTMLDWIERGMKDDYRVIVKRLGITLYGNIANSIHNFEQIREH